MGQARLVGPMSPVKVGETAATAGQDMAGETAAVSGQLGGKNSSEGGHRQMGQTAGRQKTEVNPQLV